MKALRSTFLVLIAVCGYTTISAQYGLTKPRAILNHVAIYVVDLQKTKVFYNDMFQLDTIPEPFHDGKHAWYSIAPGVAMHVIQGADKPKKYYQNNHICFSVQSVEAFVQKLMAAQMQWYNANGDAGIITTRIDGVKQIWVTDPDGYWLEVNDAKF